MQRWPLAVLTVTLACAPALARVPAAPPAPGAIVTTADLLSALESSSATLSTASARVRYIKSFSEIEGGDKHVWTGQLLFSQALDKALAPALEPVPSGAPARRGFAVRFDSLIIDAGGQREQREDPKAYVFDGVWLLERRDRDKQFSKVRVVAPGSTTDPLRIGEGPLPLPIGQRPADMTARFDVKIAGGLDGIGSDESKGLRALLEGCHQLVLKPKEGTRQARDFREIRMWYTKDGLLPTFARTLNTDDSKGEVMLTDMLINPPLAAGSFDTSTPRASEGWQGAVKEFREAAPAAPAGEVDQKQP